MDDEIKIKLAKLLNPASILPNLRLARPYKAPQQNVSPDNSNQSDRSGETDKDIIPEENATVETDKVYTPEENATEKTDKDCPLEENATEETDKDCPPKENTTEETDKDYTPEENATESPPKKKLKPNDNISRALRSRQLLPLIRGDNVIRFCQEHGLLASEVTCSCGKPMRLNSKSGSDGCRWICYDRSHISKPNQTIRKGTWFESSKLALGDILWIAYMWVHQYSIISMMHECDHSNTTVMGWCASCIDFCREIVERRSQPIGGEGVTVEIFRCAIKENKKPTGRWAFGAVEHNPTNSLHLILDDENSFTLLQIFDKYILPGTKVLVNNWSFLKALTMEDFCYLTEKKSISFVDLVTNKQMYYFEMFNNKVNRLPKSDEWSKIEYGPDFFEKMYRKCLKFAPDAYLAFLKDVAMVYKPSKRYCTTPLEILR